MTGPWLLKVGGSVLADAPGRLALAHAVASRPTPPVVLHGGGQAIGRLQARLGITPSTLAGLRVTDDASREAARMVLSGLMNGDLVASLLAAGVEAAGMSGVDRGLLRCVPLAIPEGDLGWVGRLVTVRTDILHELLEAGVVPVVSPISLGWDGETYNVNADDAAVAVAVHMGAGSLHFVSDVPGVLMDGKTVECLTPSRGRRLLDAGMVGGGMALKVRAGLSALEGGVGQVWIGDLAGFTHPSSAAGTRLVPEKRQGSGQAWRGRPQPAEPEPPVATGDPTQDLGDLIALDGQVVLQNYKRPPVLFAHGSGSWLYDQAGRGYLDFTAGIAVAILGHSDREWSQVLARQARRLTHVSNLYYSAPYIRVAQRLVASSFGQRVTFCNSGSEAVETALKLVRLWHRRAGPRPPAGLVSCTGAFHGRTLGALSLTHKEGYRLPFRPLLPDVSFVPFNDPAAADAVGPDTAAVFVEPIQGEGGYHLASAEFLIALRQACQRHGALLVFDEIQCGLGRTGRLWAHQWLDITPDILVAAKPLAGGLPMGAVLMTEEVAAAVRPGDHGSTFAGGPLVCRAAEVVLDRVMADGFLATVRHRGRELAQAVADLESEHVVDIRGRGLMLALELDGVAAPVIDAARGHGLLVVGAGEKTIRLCPPLVVTSEEVQLGVTILGESIREALG